MCDDVVAAGHSQPDGGLLSADAAPGHLSDARQNLFQRDRLGQAAAQVSQGLVRRGSASVDHPVTQPLHTTPKRLECQRHQGGRDHRCPVLLGDPAADERPQQDHRGDVPDGHEDHHGSTDHGPVDHQVDVIQAVAQDRHARGDRHTDVREEERNHRPHPARAGAEPGEIREREARDQGERGGREPAQLLALLPARAAKSEHQRDHAEQQEQDARRRADIGPTVDTSGLNSSARVIESIGTTRRVLSRRATCGTGRAHSTARHRRDGRDPSGNSRNTAASTASAQLAPSADATTVASWPASGGPSAPSCRTREAYA